MRSIGKQGKNILSHNNKESAKQFALRMQPVVAEIKSEEFTTVLAITDELNNRCIPTFRSKSKGQKWHIPGVRALLMRLN